ncbi:MAG: site-2 protease family protein, partial [Patescibacteria group bacterium]
FAFIAYLNVYLAVFNLVPIPPLDGSKLLPILFPRFAAQIERIGLMGIAFVFLFLFLFSSVISYIAGHIFLFVAGPNVLGSLYQFLASFQG